MPTCPNGHRSAADDWCEVCGHRMTAPGAPGAVPPPPPAPPPPAPDGYGYGYPAPPPPPPYDGPGGPGGHAGHGGPGDSGGYGYPGEQAPPSGPGMPQHPGAGIPDRPGPAAPVPPGPTQHTELCPQCRTPREPHAPFCEECRYNFHTQSPTAYAPPAPPPGFLQQGPPPVYERSRPSQMNRPAEPLSQQPQQPAHAPEPGDWNIAPPSTPVGEPHGQGGYGYPGPGAGTPARGTGWMVTVGPDREYFTAMMQRSGPEGATLNLPAYSPEQQVPLSGQQVSIGRRRQSTGEAPDIDLSRPPEDPGVSHQHALLVQQPDGGWAVVDQDSTNGTTINGGEDPIQPFVPVPLHEGDRVHVGAWTTLTVRRA
ncbi:hypothetical protein GCM10023347_37030 [Streptomyces chumphonensis]|uniref:FHA domain-containing protein n=1 Tax=Streptomyces chumphonensis TaxID=1214925 RepID=A0A927EW88_9ACTN|nr:FHA domain-containing protein [Streptomyces chumphonensis]MBD3930761.1 FHA domain-containing protein [Streptomyces chumphonensis]